MICSFKISLLASFWVVGFPCFAGELIGDEVVIGEFTLAVDASVMNLQSYYVAEDDFSDLTVHEKHGIATYYVSASTDEGLPLLDVVLQEGSVIGDLSIVSVTFIDQDYDSALAASSLIAGGVALDSLGVIMDEVVELNDERALSFSFNAKLVRINLDSATPIAGADGAHITASFTGQFPKSEWNE